VAPASALDARFGSSLHTVYRSPAGPALPSSAIVVAPSLLGSELNATNFHDIRAETEKVWQKGHSDPDWSFGTKAGHNGVVKVPCRDLVHQTGSDVNDAIHRIVEYFRSTEERRGWERCTGKAVRGPCTVRMTRTF
jgi:hypothetical protein